ncbi:MAG: PA2779 family protein [Humidesulfovibrio sp.]|uniref:PA2779 family protein n=1 Tax=Humidesulfovibrio sp. TaxID=2910988 RepID=UPI0027FA1AB8|nr:PA2779 family protein [Humidesulfovibrio sp.]MDQ7834583.1 PA2779 family protein [Humidesulfovibrio sp.]
MTTLPGAMVMRNTAFLLIMLMSTLAFVPRAEASMVPTSLTMVAEARDQDLSTVQKVLENKAVKARLSALGYTDQEISGKLSLLSNDELSSLASQLNALDAGGDGLGIVVTLLVIVLLVVVILKLSNKTVSVH